MRPGVSAGRRRWRVAMLSMHTSPLDRPGTGDAGGMNVYVGELARRLAARGVEVDVFTRANSHLQSDVELAPGLTVRPLVAGPVDGLTKADLPGQLCPFARELLRFGANRAGGSYDLVHAHYWLSGQAGLLVSDRWGVPLVASMHTLARVKNAVRPAAEPAEPQARIVGEQAVVEAADRLIANTDDEAGHLVEHYGASPAKVVTVPPGVDPELFRPGDGARARARLGLPAGAHVVLYVGRRQPLKAPDLLLRAAARMLQAEPGLRDRLVVAFVGGSSGTTDSTAELATLAGTLRLDQQVRFVPPVARDRLVDWYRAATVLCVPSYHESFGLVALEAQACGTPVVAAAVGGLPAAVRHGRSGLLVSGHHPDGFANALGSILGDSRVRARMSRAAVAHAATFDWATTVSAVLEVYRQSVAEYGAGSAGRRAIQAPAGRYAAPA